MSEYPNISREEALESINGVILYLRQFGFNDKDAFFFSGESKKVEAFIFDRKNEKEEE